MRSGAIVRITSLLLCLSTAVAAATIGVTSLAPSSASTGTGTQVTVTSVITDPGVVGSSVNLQRMDSQGRVLAVTGNLRDDGLNGDAIANDKTFSLRFTVFENSPGPLTFRVSAGVAGSLTRIFSSPMTFNVTGTGAGIQISAPANLQFLSTSPVTVLGTIGDPAAQVTVNGLNANKSGNSFQLTVPLVEGNNTLTAVTKNSNGSTNTASIQVTLDTTPPQVTVLSPVEGSTTVEGTVTVTGIVNDIVVGTVNDQQARVTVNGIPAVVSNRTFLATNVPLQTGANIIQALARDQVGNSATTSVSVIRQAPPNLRLRKVSGDLQSAVIGTQLPLPLTVQLLNGASPAANSPVVFKVTENDGYLTPGAGKPAAILVNTDSQGMARVNLVAGSRSGAGNNAVEASATGFAGTGLFTASGLPQPASKINVDSGNNQTATIGQSLALPFVAIVTDPGNNRIGGVPVTFTVKSGGGSISGASTKTAISDPDGRALALLTAGSQPGPDSNVVEATFAGNSGLAAVFTASSKVPGAIALTKVTGVVLDNSNNPIQNVTMRLFLTNQGGQNNQPVQVGTPVITNAQGFFNIQPAPVGFFKLMADGSTASAGLKSYPTLEYDIVTVAGQDNTVGMPIYLPVLDQLAKVCVNETTGGTLTSPKLPGFSLKIAPGGATFPGGARSGCVSVSGVNPDKVPMTPGFGQQPRFIVTIQPVGTVFNPPAAITIPNVDGLSPRSKTEMYSYDHDLAAFVAIGAATVSDDGSLIASDPGVGVLKAGWHCGGDPNTSGGAQTVTVTPSETKVILPKGQKADLTAIGDPAPIGTPAYTWTSKDPAKATVTQPGGTQAHPNKGQITAVANGKTTVDVKYVCKSGANATSTIDVIVVEAKFEEAAACSGFDKSLTPPALMAPKGGTNTAKLVINPGDAAPELKLESAAAGTAEAAPVNPSASPQTVTVTGNAKGTTQILVKPKSGPASALTVTALDVDVKDKLTKTVVIHAITESNDDVQTLAVGVKGATAAAVCVSIGANGFRDSIPAGDDTAVNDTSNILVGADLTCNTAANKTNLVPTNVPTAAALQTYLNNVIGKQTNIIVTVTRRDVTVNYDLNRNGGVPDPPVVNEMNAISAAAKDAGDINMYFVNVMDAPVATTIISRGEGWIQDSHSGSTNYVAAHEIFHAMGRSGHSPDAIDLMFASDSASSPCNIKRAEWNTVNP